jgi:glycosyltransferase involved in cell wall biosynthesis
VEGVDDLPAALVDAIRRPERMRALADVGRWQVLRRYDWDALADRLERLWLRCVDGGAA